MLVFVQKTGKLYNSAGVMLAEGYSGLGMSKNDPEAQMLPGQGPIPVGKYTIQHIADAGVPVDYGNKKAPVLRLIPDATNEMFWRAGFLIHGDNVAHTASDGCIIMPHETREQIWNGEDDRLEVIADDGSVTHTGELGED